MKVTEEYKQTEVGLIPSDWKVTKLFEVIEANRSIRYGIVQPGKFEPNGCLMLRSQDYSKGWSNSNEMHRVNAELENQYKNARLNKDDLIMTVVGAGIGQVVIAPDWLDKAIVSRSTARIAVDKTKAAKEYILCCLTSPLGVRQILDAQKEGAQPVISCLDLAKFNIPYPSLKEQTAIATALSDADALISNLEKLIAKKRNIKQGAMQKLLLPKEGWTNLPISSLANISTGAKNTQDRIEDGMYPFFVRSQNIERINSFSYQGEAILIAGDGVGTGKVMHYYNGKFDFHQRVYKLSDFNSCIIGLYFFLYFKNNFYERMMQMTAKSSVDSIRRDMISNMIIPFPSREEQTRIATILSDMDAEINALEIKLEKYKKVKLGMMQNLLTGRIRLV
ncbi:type I restriction enzyme, S subunit [Aquiflexum balticum DSM 16537]|uniref:Type I restriction enzyme, S subunit n=1 Tax=Aquiflexum balticum DSM 16537 TaxID=758820 RepID=A0A1W2HAA0_9BACT|nr:restriction endonuclease subunit S [Aquiflexum balticum]SMD45820.1 type I restriction enzyme, S subunit [Aquiflexum balticum DSM 16537]